MEQRIAALEAEIAALKQQNADLVIALCNALKAIQPTTIIYPHPEPYHPTWPYPNGPIWYSPGPTITCGNFMEG